MTTTMYNLIREQLIDPSDYFACVTVQRHFAKEGERLSTRGIEDARTLGTSSSYNDVVRCFVGRKGDCGQYIMVHNEVPRTRESLDRILEGVAIAEGLRPTCTEEDYLLEFTGIPPSLQGEVKAGRLKGDELVRQLLDYEDTRTIAGNRIKTLIGKYVQRAVLSGERFFVHARGNSPIVEAGACILLEERYVPQFPEGEGFAVLVSYGRKQEKRIVGKYISLTRIAEINLGDCLRSEESRPLPENGFENL